MWLEVGAILGEGDDGKHPCIMLEPLLVKEMLNGTEVNSGPAAVI